jgi:tRNA threonylcarbamoyladenosine biosynthesis protein TsaB
MILLLDTSTPICRLATIDGDSKRTSDWDAGRTLAKGLLKFIDTELNKSQKTWSDITAIGVFEGPGSFTGLRIGLTVMNTVADSEGIPIVSARGDDWQEEALSKINAGVNQKMILPFYDNPAHITISTK